MKLLSISMLFMFSMLSMLSMLSILTSNSNVCDLKSKLKPLSISPPVTGIIVEMLIASKNSEDYIQLSTHQ